MSRKRIFNIGGTAALAPVTKSKNERRNIIAKWNQDICRIMYAGLIGLLLIVLLVIWIYSSTALQIPVTRALEPYNATLHRLVENSDTCMVLDRPEVPMSFSEDAVSQLKALPDDIISGEAKFEDLAAARYSDFSSAKRGGDLRLVSWKDPDGTVISKTSRQDAVSQLKGLSDDIVSGNAKFEDVAARYSHCSSAKRGGDLGPGRALEPYNATLHRLVENSDSCMVLDRPEVPMSSSEDAVSQLKALPDDIVSGEAKFEDLAAARYSDFSSAKRGGDLRLVSWKDPDGTVISKTSRQDAVSQLKGLSDDIVSGNAKFEDVAARYSHCSSAKRGGDLGSFGKGQMQEPSEEATSALKIC